MFAAWLPAETGLWFFGALLVGLHRLGRKSLRLIPFEEDRSLGLRPLGSVAFTSFVVMTTAVLPLVATQWRDLRSAITNLLFFLGFVALFFASLHGLHRQMVKAKASVLELTHHLYVEASDRYAGMGTSWEPLCSRVAAGLGGQRGSNGLCCTFRYHGIPQKSL